MYVRDLACTGAIGELRTVRYEDSIPMSPLFAKSWRNDPDLAGGGVLLDLGCHTLSAGLGIIGRHSSSAVLEDVQLRRGRYSVETEATLRIRVANVCLFVSIRLVDEGSKGYERLILFGTTGRISLRRQRGASNLSRVQITSPGLKSSIPIPVGTDFDSENLRRFMAHPQAAPNGNLWSHLAALRLISQAYGKAEASSDEIALKEVPYIQEEWLTEAGRVR